LRVAYLALPAKQEVLRIVRRALSGQTGEVDDPVIASVLPNGPRAFPKDFLGGDIGAVRAIELPEERLTFRQLAVGVCVAESHFGFRLDVRNETEGMFIVHAHSRGARTLALPEKMIHLFKAVTGYRGYLRNLWQDLYRAYGRECGDRAAAYSHTKTAFETLGLLPPDEAQLPPVAQDDEPGERRTKLKRGLRTPETAFYAPILQALDELGGTARTSDVVKRVGEFMADVFSPDDREALPSTGLPRWENTTQFARYSMVRSGLLKPDSPRGTWGISAKGMEHLTRTRNA
jgi:Mrr N-terminal domain